MQYSKAQIQRMPSYVIVDYLSQNYLTWKEVETALEEINAYEVLDSIGDKLAKLELREGKESESDE